MSSLSELKLSIFNHVREVKHTNIIKLVCKFHHPPIHDIVYTLRELEYEKKIIFFKSGIIIAKEPQK